MIRVLIKQNLSLPSSAPNMPACPIDLPDRLSKQLRDRGAAQSILPGMVKQHHFSYLLLSIVKDGLIAMESSQAAALVKEKVSIPQLNILLPA